MTVVFTYGITEGNRLCAVGGMAVPLTTMWPSPVSALCSSCDSIKDSKVSDLRP